MKKYNAFDIKLLMAGLMVLDHIGAVPGLLPPLWQGVFHALTRCVAVWFAYMAVEGYVHTRSRLKYNLRLFFWAGIMLAGNSLLNYLFADKGVEVHNNIFLSLALGELTLNVLFTPLPGAEEPRGRKRAALTAVRAVAAAAIFYLGAFYSEGGILIIPFMAVTFALRDRPGIRNLLYAAMSALLIASGWVSYPTARESIEMFLFNCDGLFITVLPFIYLYDGTRGPETKFSKYFFYVFYPAHLWLITAIAYAVK